MSLPGPGVKLEWTVGGDAEDYLAEPSPGPARRRRRAWLALTLTALFLLTAIVLGLRQRIAHNQRQLRADLQALVDLEAQAIASGDLELFLSLQSEQNSAWLVQRQTDFTIYARNAPDLLRLNVTRVEPVDDYAWVYATGTLPVSGKSVDQVLFYRRVGNSWFCDAPDARYWGAEREQDVGPLHFVYHERDEPYIRPLAADLSKSWLSLCNALGCSPALSLTVQLLLPFPHDRLRPAEAEPDVFLLPSLAAAAPQPTPDSLEFLSYYYFRYDALTHYLAFESAGGRMRWESDIQGAWLIHAAANWAQERLKYGTTRPSGLLHPERGQRLLRLAVRDGFLLPLDVLWRDHDLGAYNSFNLSAYPHITWDSDLANVQAQAVIDYVAEAYSPEAVRKLLQAISRHDTLQATLQDALGVGLGEFEAGWRNWLETYYGFGKGRRLTEAVLFWEFVRNSSPVLLLRGSAVFRQYQELLRMAVQQDRVLPLTELWSRERPSAASQEVVYLSSAGPTQFKVLAERPPLPYSNLGVGGDPVALTMPVGVPGTWRSAHALAMIEYVARVYGQQAVYDLLPSIVSHDTLDGALREALGVSLAEFELSWLAWLETRFGDSIPGE